MNVDMNEGILIQDLDTDIDIAEEESLEVIRSITATTEESKKFLREQLRKTLSGKEMHKGRIRCSSSFKPLRLLNELQEHDTPIFQDKKRQDHLHELSLKAGERLLLPAFCFSEQSSHQLLDFYLENILY
jgi:hypothetical protein